MGYTYSSGSRLTARYLIFIRLLIIFITISFEVLRFLELHVPQLYVLLIVIHNSECTFDNLLLAYVSIALSKDIISLKSELNGRESVLTTLHISLSCCELFQIRPLDTEDR
jgi:hypothetical protein